MGISHSTDYASDTDSESYKKAKRSASISNFFGLFSAAKKYDYLDSTDSEITLETSRKRNKRDRNRNVQDRQEAHKQTDDKIYSGQRDSSKFNTSKENFAQKNITAPAREDGPKEIACSEKVDKELDDRSKQETRKPVKGGQATPAKDIDGRIRNYIVAYCVYDGNLLPSTKDFAYKKIIELTDDVKSSSMYKSKDFSAAGSSIQKCAKCHKYTYHDSNTHLHNETSSNTSTDSSECPECNNFVAKPCPVHSFKTAEQNRTPNEPGKNYLHSQTAQEQNNIGNGKSGRCRCNQSASTSQNSKRASNGLSGTEQSDRSSHKKNRNYVQEKGVSKENKAPASEKRTRSKRSSHIEKVIAECDYLRQNEDQATQSDTSQYGDKSSQTTSTSDRYRNSNSSPRRSSLRSGVPTFVCRNEGRPLKGVRRTSLEQRKQNSFDVYSAFASYWPVSQAHQVTLQNNTDHTLNTHDSDSQCSTSLGSSDDFNTLSSSSKIEVMQDYRRYSREPPEKESHHNDNCTVHHNMKNCCRGCIKDKPLYVNNSGCLGNKCSRYTCKSGELSFNSNNNNSRHVSDPHVSRNKVQPCNQKPLISKSAPLNLRQDPARVSSQQRSPKIPLPPPPPVKLSQRDKKKPQNTVINRQQMHNQYGFYNKPQQQHYRQYPYEEPPDSSSYSCCSRNCNGYEQCPQHRSCKCRCKCEYDNYYRQYISDDQASCGSESTKTDFMNLAYQRTGDYPELVDELENTLSQRNRLRVQKTMQQFEMLSRQNKNLDKPIFDDEESTRHHHHRSKRESHCTSEDCRCSCCKTSTPSDRHKSGTETYKSRSESLSKRSSCHPASMPKPSGYVEKVARCMDPNYDKLSKFGKSLQQRKNNNNTIWQMDARKGEWVKVSRPNQYDFENNYPPLPPRPRSGQPYSHPEKPERQSAHHEYPDTCGCNKCSRRR